MPRKGINRCPKCKQWGCTASVNEKDQLIGAVSTLRTYLEINVQKRAPILTV